MAQDESGVIHADKVSSEESLLDFAQPATTLHNKVCTTQVSICVSSNESELISFCPDQVRGFAGWPGTKARFVTENKNGGEDTVSLKVCSSSIADSCTNQTNQGISRSYIPLNKPCKTRFQVVRTRLGVGPRAEGSSDTEVTFVGKQALQVACDDGSLLEVRPQPA